MTFRNHTDSNKFANFTVSANPTLGRKKGGKFLDTIDGACNTVKGEGIYLKNYPGT
jgi:hypothetical protein